MLRSCDTQQKVEVMYWQISISCVFIDLQLKAMEALSNSAEELNRDLFVKMFNPLIGEFISEKK